MALRLQTILLFACLIACAVQPADAKFGLPFKKKKKQPPAASAPAPVTQVQSPTFKELAGIPEKKTPATTQASTAAPKKVAAPAQSKADNAALTYDKALQALQSTKKHSDAATSWGERRTITVPKGVDPQSVIKKELSKLPNLTELEREKLLQQQRKKAAAANGGWDWLSSQDTAKTAPAPATKTPAAVNPTASAPAATAPAPVPQTAPVASPAVSSTPASPVENVPFSSPPGVRTTPLTATQAAPATTSTTTGSAGSDDSLDLGLNEPESPAPGASNTAAQKQAATPRQTPAAAPAKSGREEAVAHYNTAVKLHLSGKLGEAIAEYKSALAANPELGQAHCNLGLIFNQQHNYANALTEFRKALAINPQDAITYNGIGAALRAQKDFEGAIKNWQTAISLNPGLATAHYNLGTVYELRKEYDKALDQYKKAIKNDFKLGEAYYRSGLVLTRQDNLEAAKAQFSQALKISDRAEYSADARKRLAALEQKTQ